MLSRNHIFGGRVASTLLFQLVRMSPENRHLQDSRSSLRLKLVPLQPEALHPVHQLIYGWFVLTTHGLGGVVGRVFHSARHSLSDIEGHDVLFANPRGTTALSKKMMKVPIDGGRIGLEAPVLAAEAVKMSRIMSAVNQDNPASLAEFVCLLAA